MSNMTMKSFTEHDLRRSLMLWEVATTQHYPKPSMADVYIDIVKPELDYAQEKSAIGGRNDQ